MTRALRLCVVCSDRVGRPHLCQPCQRSYDTTLGGDVLGALVWAASRARRFERRRGRTRLAAVIARRLTRPG